MHRNDLGGGACVDELFAVVNSDHAACVADTNRARIVAVAVCALQFDGPAWLYTSIKTDKKVIADAFPASGLVPKIHVGSRDVLVGSGLGAMDYNFVNLSHSGVIEK